MKPLSIALLCLFILAPFLLMMEVRCDALMAAHSLRAHYDMVLDNAISDAADQMALHASETGYADASELRLASDLAVERFFASLCDGMGANTAVSRDRLRTHVPVIVVATREEALLYMPQSVEADDGSATRQYLCLHAAPYALQVGEGSPLVLFTMGSGIHVLSRETGESGHADWHAFSENGQRRDNIGTLETLPLFESVEEFESRRLKTIRDVVTQQLDTGLRLFSDTQSNGQFDLPASKAAAFRNAVSDVGLFAFVQGLPVGSEQTYQTFAFGGGRVVKREPVTGWAVGEDKRYCAPDCPLLLEHMAGGTLTPDDFRYFSSPREAAAEGYKACSGCRP